MREEENGGVMTIALESMAVEMPRVEGHPNRAEFRGVLTVVDVASQRAPSGSKGRKVVLTRRAAEAALPSLLGMALDYAPSFDRHDVRRKVGVITSAEIVGRDLEIGGYLYAKDFPEIVEEIEKSGMNLSSSRPGGRVQVSAEFRGVAAEARDWKASLAEAMEKILRMSTRAEPPRGMSLQAGGEAGGALGMSYEVTGVQVEDQRAKIWALTKVTFTGAAILRRDKAAYAETWIGIASSRES